MIDLHTHTTVSDGGDSPTELVRKAAAAGLDAIAVTDHDNDSGCDEAVEAGLEAGVEVIRAVEISCDVDDLATRGFTPSARPTMHLLGYCIPAGPNPLTAALAELQAARAGRNERMVAKLQELGVSITFEEVEAEAGGPGAQIGRPHFAAVLVRNGAATDYQDAFDRWLAKGAPGYLSRKLYSPAEAIQLMLSAGVVPVLAHPFTLHLNEAEIEDFVSALCKAGLRGIEGWHGDLPADEQAPFRALGEKHYLVVSGGSDYHGDMRPDRGLPGGKHGVTVPDDVLPAIKSIAEGLTKVRS
ncbi:MAG TPA: PHP domain-containing protein [Actinomycetota bacterium]|nr:PHP domain-containing protein [Actinomycetota bacterium]